MISIYKKVRWYWANWRFRPGKEVSLIQLLKTLTIKRIWNVLQILTSFTISAMLKKSIVWGIPPVLNIEPTNICNLKCPLCVTGNNTMERARGKMDFATFRHFLDQVAERSIYITLYHQGEPYINNKFIEFVTFAKQKGLYVTTSSNGHYFDQKNAEATVRCGLDSIIISVDGVSQKSYVHYRRGGKLEKVLEGIRTLVAVKKQFRSKTPYVFVQFLVMKHNEHEIPAMNELARELGVDRLLIKTTQVETLEEAKEWLPEADRYKRYNIEGNGLKVKGSPGACPRPWLTTVIDWDGVIAPCCFDKNTNHPMGHVNSEIGFEHQWQGEAYTKFRHTLLTNRKEIDICKNCNQGIGVFK